jgi:ketosteroid isomerase-like protein
MQESSEVRDVVLRFYERMSAGDIDGTSATIDDDPEAFVVGTQRIGSGREAWMDSVRDNVEAGVVFEAGAIRAWAEGDFGWAIDEPTIVLPEGTGLPTRMTAVLRRAGDGGGFRLLHQHYSVAVPDELAVEQANTWREQLGLVKS